MAFHGNRDTADCLHYDPLVAAILPRPHRPTLHRRQPAHRRHCPDHRRQRLWNQLLPRQLHGRVGERTRRISTRQRPWYAVGDPANLFPQPPRIPRRQHSKGQHHPGHIAVHQRHVTNFFTALRLDRQDVRTCLRTGRKRVPQHLPQLSFAQNRWRIAVTRIHRRRPYRPAQSPFPRLLQLYSDQPHDLRPPLRLLSHWRQVLELDHHPRSTQRLHPLQHRTRHIPIVIPHLAPRALHDLHRRQREVHFREHFPGPDRQPATGRHWIRCAPEQQIFRAIDH